MAPSPGASGGGTATQSPGAQDGPFAIGGPERGVVDLDASSIAFAGFEWAVPALVLSVPGLFLIIAVAVETLIGLAWLPVARRWVGEDKRSRGRQRRLSPS